MTERTTAERLWDEIEGFIEAGHSEALYAAWERMHLTEKRRVKEELSRRIGAVLLSLRADLGIELEDAIAQTLARVV
jgi:hypothetical protein